MHDLDAVCARRLQDARGRDGHRPERDRRVDRVQLEAAGALGDRHDVVAMPRRMFR
jgi:hypothetical protein